MLWSELKKVQVIDDNNVFVLGMIFFPLLLMAYVMCQFPFFLIKTDVTGYSRLFQDQFTKKMNCQNFASETYFLFKGLYTKDFEKKTVKNWTGLDWKNEIVQKTG